MFTNEEERSRWGGGGREREARESEGGREEERDGGREAADVDTTLAPSGLNSSPCQRLG